MDAASLERFDTARDVRATREVELDPDGVVAATEALHTFLHRLEELTLDRPTEDSMTFTAATLFFRAPMSASRGLRVGAVSALPVANPIRTSRPFRRLVLARLVSHVGDGIALIALVLLVQEDRGTGTSVGALLLATAIRDSSDRSRASSWTGWSSDR